jgi:hypothetical protein
VEVEGGGGGDIHKITVHPLPLFSTASVSSVRGLLLLYLPLCRQFAALAVAVSCGASVCRKESTSLQYSSGTGCCVASEQQTLHALFRCVK